MEGLFGVVSPGSSRLEAAGSSDHVRALGGERPALCHPSAAMWAGGWASVCRAPDGVDAAGTAHLVGVGRRVGAPEPPLASVIEAYRGQGPTSVGHLDGQFCVALWDNPSERLVLAIDRFSTRPLYYGESSGSLFFSSHLRWLPRQLRERVDRQAILEYLLYEVIPTPRTPFTGVRKLRPGHLLIADRAGVREVPYWDMTYVEGNGGAATWARRLRGELEDAVRRYVAAEASTDAIGAFLSGGTDSSTVAGMMCRSTGRPAKTFSIGYREQRYSELSYARAAARWFGTEHHERQFTPDEAFALLPAIVRFYEEPFGNASALPTYACARFAREHGVRVLFAGDGGDELFAGNQRYRTDKIFSLYERVPALARRWLTDPLAAALPDAYPFDRVRRYIRRANIPNPRRVLSYGLLLSNPPSELLTEDFAGSVDLDALMAIAQAHFSRLPPGTSELNRLMYLDLRLAVADSDVRKVSGMTELAGIEVRYPLLDTTLAEFSGRIPTGLKLRGLEKRYIFKRALADFLPPEVLTKPKHGFGAPVSVWMRNDACWREFVGDLLHDRRTRERGYVRASFLETLHRQLQAEREAFYGDTLWPLLMLELWHREHVDLDGNRDGTGRGGTRHPDERGAGR